MSVRKIEIGCDVPGCWAYYSMTGPNAEVARELAAERCGWTRGENGADICAPCGHGDTPQARAEQVGG
jgi:ribosomal protein L37E